MAEFNLEDYPEVEKKFNLEDYPEIPKERGFLERAARVGLNTLPGIGAIGGGLIGAVGGGGVASPVTGVVGASLGMGLGTALKQAGEGLLGDEQNIDDLRKQQLKAALEGATYEMGGQVLGAIPGLAKQGVRGAKEWIAEKTGQQFGYTPAQNVDEVLSAAKNLGIEDVPKGMKTSNKTFQDVESGLSQSGTFAAKKTRDQYNAMFDKLEKASEKISGLQSSDSQFASGKGIQEELSSQVKKMQEPVSEMYQSIQPHLQKIQVNKSVVNKAFGALKRDPIFQTKDGKAMLEEYKAITASQPELASLKELRSSISGAIGPNTSPLEAKRINEIRNAITSVRDNTIEALKVEMPKATHGEIDDLISQISLADKAHASTINEINQIKGVIGNKDFTSPSTFLSKLGSAQEANIAEKASNLDIKSLMNMKEKFPSVFEKARQAKINEMVGGSTNPISGFQDARFLKKYGEMDKELKDLIFDPEMQSHIESLSTFRQAIPPKLGPSGTPKGIFTMEMWDPRRNLLDVGSKLGLDVASGARQMSLPIQEGARGLSRITPIFSYQSEDQQKPKYDNNAVMQKIKGTKYEQVLNNAKQNGEQSAAAAHYVLSNQDQEYRKLLDEENLNEPNQ